MAYEESGLILGTSVEEIGYLQKLYHLLFNKETFKHSSALAYNVQSLTTYLYSALYFPSHIRQAKGIPDEVKEFFGDSPIYELNKPWHPYAMAALGIFSILMLIATQRSMPSRLDDMFGWNKGDKEEAYGIKKAYIITESILVALGKTVITSSSLWALLGEISFIGYSGGLGIAVAVFPGVFAAQLTQFLEPLFKKIFPAKLPALFSKISSGYLSSSFTLSSEAIYSNTLIYGAARNKWRHGSLLTLENPAARIMVDAGFASMALNFSYVTLTSYYSRILHSLQSAYTDEERQQLLVNGEPSGIKADVIITVAQRVTVKGTFAAIFKDLANIISFYGIVAIIFSTTFGIELDLGGLVGIFLLSLIVSVLSHPTQTTFFNNSDEKIKKMGGNAGLVSVKYNGKKVINQLSNWCPKRGGVLEINVPDDEEHGSFLLCSSNLNP